jgi:hypothetical protein
MMATYIPCPGTGLIARNAKLVTGMTGKFFKMNGKTYGDCPACQRRLNLPDRYRTPRHKGPALLDEYGRAIKEGGAR